MICDIFPCQIDEKFSKETAIKENVFNASLNININEKEDSSTPRLFTKFAKLWKPETALKISFLNGSTSDRNYVETIARTWEQYCNIYLIFGNFPDAQIRINITSATSNDSYMGTDNLTIPSNKATMNLRDVGSAATILHEFGHALGFYHEHQHPHTPIVWNNQKVYDWFAKAGWSKEKVDFNVINKYPERGYYFSGYDVLSIMHYHFDPTLISNGITTYNNNSISNNDKSWARSCYPTMRQWHTASINQELNLEMELQMQMGVTFNVDADSTYLLNLKGSDSTKAILYSGADFLNPVTPLKLNDTNEINLAAGNYIVRLIDLASEKIANVKFIVKNNNPIMKAEATRSKAPKDVNVGISSGDRLEIKSIGKPDDRAQITFGEPQPGGPVNYISLGENEIADVTDKMTIGKNVMLLSISNSGHWDWSGTFDILKNGVSVLGTPYGDKGSDNVFGGFHTLIRLVVIYRP